MKIGEIYCKKSKKKKTRFGSLSPEKIQIEVMESWSMITLKKWRTISWIVSKKIKKQPLLFSNILRSHFCTITENLISGALYCWWRLAVLSEDIGAEKAISEHLPLNLNNQNIKTRTSIWRMMLFKPILRTMGNSKREIKLASTISKSTLISNITVNITFRKKFTLNFNQWL